MTAGEQPTQEPAEVAPGTSLVTSDPAVLRALAHPLRVEILAVLDDLREATATEIAERVGESPSNCSFHLRQLEKAGYIERAPQRGTAKPWRPKHVHRNLAPDADDPASVRSSAALSALYVQREAARVVDYLQSVPETPEWTDVVTINLSSFWATPDEMQQLATSIAQLTAHLPGRESDPSKRPPGSRRGYLFATLNPDPRTPPTPEA
ncbi:winged helix-turn-helix domain-containing protein [Agrococcus jejuensis]|uniref:Helix-turn-helix domain-containing protein n=1 Tax=Agrococcus jejuensis TaxID=399736 RepID=A0A1G8CJ97_9MICO|nr:winged helix-turn-helix domain-containing protein [Agrococcus jejuensis]SDH45505.1 Helix-turn-helix domain-containing protein [Agrococcus jejuensis]